MAIIKAIMDKGRKLRMRKDCIREIIPIDGMPNCYNLVRDDSDTEKGDYQKDEKITYKTGFNLDSVYKYIDYEGFIKTLKTGFLFKEPSKWPDPYEKRFYNANYHNIDNNYVPKPLYSCCFTTGNETDASWKQYAGSTGFSSKAVRICLNYRKLVELLSHYAIKNNSNVYIGAVTYQYKQQEIDDLHVNYKAKSFWLTKFSLRNYLSLLLIKRDAFYNEKEVRVFVVPQFGSAMGDDGKLFVESGVRWDEIIKEVLLCPEASEEEKMFFQWLCNRNGITCNVKKSTLKEEQSEIDIYPVEKKDSFIADIYDEL